MKRPVHMELSVKSQSRKINKIEYNTVGKKSFFKQKEQQAAGCLTSQRATKKTTTDKQIQSSLSAALLGIYNKTKTYCNLISHWQSI